LCVVFLRLQRKIPQNQTLLELPSELLCEITSFISPKDVQTLLNFELTSCIIYHVYQNNPIWQQQYKLLIREDTLQDYLSCKRIVIQLGEHMDKRDIKQAANLNVGTVIQCLLQGTRKLTESEIRGIICRSNILLLKEPSLLELQSPIHIVGDIHGHYNDLIHIFNTIGFPSKTNRYLFLGDYVDRGENSIEVICLLFAFKIKYPNNIFLLRGQHECASMNRIYGFYSEVKRDYNIRLWKLVTEVFKVIPIAAVVSDTFFCVHGGISPYLNNIQQIKDIIRTVDIPYSGLLYDLLWSRFDHELDSWADDGTSFSYGMKMVEKHLDLMNMKVMIRSQEVVENGYEHFDRIVTVFSASDYCGEFGNFGAVVTINEMNKLEFIKYRL
jgi:serine/threonine-protein phosphatase PP1 catalytic subunit